MITLETSRQVGLQQTITSYGAHYTSLRESKHVLVNEHIKALRRPISHCLFFFLQYFPTSFNQGT